MDEVKHDATTGEFYLETEDGKAFLCYRIDENYVDFFHTFVPPGLRGKGVAEQIVAKGFAYAQQQQLQVLPSCSYVKKLAKKNPAWEQLIV